MHRVSLCILLTGVFVLASASDIHSVSVYAPLSLSAQPQQDSELLQIFSGTIVMSNGSFFLTQEVNGMLYGLDNQALASKFANKSVAVTGTLDKSETIHVKNIEESKA